MAVYACPAVLLNVGPENHRAAAHRAFLNKVLMPAC
jgi:hypothetical protein